MTRTAPLPEPAELTRRRFLQGSALAGFSAFLAACGGGASPAPSAGASAAPSAAASPTPKVASGPLEFANWTAYIDLAGDAEEYAPGASPTLEQFKEKYKVDVDYQEKIEDNPTFVETIKPALVAGLPTGWDLVVLTDWMAGKLVANGWVEKIDQANVPNCVANLRDALRGVNWDPTNDYHYPWQSGMTGVGYNARALADNGIPEPTKISDIYAIPADKVTMLTESRDTFGLALLKLGIEPDPDNVTGDDLQKVFDDLSPLVAKGLRFTGNSYLQDFADKNVWAAFVWSGDLASSGGEDDRFIFPEEGHMVWTDNMLIPKGAANKYTAELMMDFVYDPVVAAQMANWIYYVSPVKGADEEIKKLDPEAAANPLLFPPADLTAKGRNFQFLPDDLEATLNDLFSTLSGT